VDAELTTTVLGALLNDAYDQLAATAFTTGSGSGQPTGIITALAASSPPIRHARHHRRLEPATNGFAGGGLRKLWLVAETVGPQRGSLSSENQWQPLRGS
jgi:hypothetical protein